MNRAIPFTVALLAFLPSDKSPAQEGLSQTPLFVSGQNGYHTYRIPALIVSKKGTVLAFCEARKNSASDLGDIDLVIRRSEDGGKSWGKMEILSDDGGHTMGNPCPVVDQKSGVIWLPFCRDNHHVFIMKSDDDGKTWSKPVDITRDAKDPIWHWVGTGPGLGIQLRSGRLLIPCWAGREADVTHGKTQRSFVFYSDDAGKTWKRGAGLESNDSDECQAVELADGSIYLTLRTRLGRRARSYAISKDGGDSFSKPTLAETLIDPVCQASVVRLPGKDGGILFSNPASAKREKMTVRLSRDEGKTWPIARVLHEGPSAYSCLAVLPNGDIGCLYERGEKNAYQTLTFAIHSRGWLAASGGARPPEPTLVPLSQTVDLNVGESQEVTLSDGKKVTVKLLDLRESRDSLRKAVRRAEITVDVAGQKVTLVSANYHLPVTAGGVQIDCPVTKGYREQSTRDTGGRDPWGLDRDVRLRLWPSGSPIVNPGTFTYPARQRWFASATQMANEPVHVDGGENPLAKSIYYHYGLDIGGAEGMVEVVAATDGLVVSSGKAVLPGYEDTPVSPRYDVIYLLDARGWYYRYSHLHTIGSEVRPGQKVKMGQLIGLLGKEGGSGGWSHLHFDISARQPSGKWGIVEGYAFLWEAYLRQHNPALLAVARPHHLAAIGEKVLLDGTRSWSSAGEVKAHDWTFTDGTRASGATVERVYSKPGVYSEVLKITDSKGRTDYDFAIVNVLDPKKPEQLPPSIHAVFYPTTGIKADDPVTFMVRTFRTTDGKETWDFGDGSEKVTVQSDGNVVQLARDGYARTVHAFKRAGHYLVRVERTNRVGFTAIAHLHVRVGQD